MYVMQWHFGIGMYNWASWNAHLLSIHLISNGNNFIKFAMQGSFEAWNIPKTIVNTLDLYQRYISLFRESMLPGAKGFLGETLCMTRTMPRPTQQVTRLHFWHNRMGDHGLARHEPNWACLGPNGGLDDPRHGRLPPSTVPELRRAVLLVWAAIRQRRMGTLVESMPHGVRAHLASRDGVTQDISGVHV